jgi:hypothetical protein
MHINQLTHPALSILHHQSGISHRPPSIVNRRPPPSNLPSFRPSTLPSSNCSSKKRKFKKQLRNNSAMPLVVPFVPFVLGNRNPSIVTHPSAQNHCSSPRHPSPVQHHPRAIFPVAQATLIASNREDCLSLQPKRSGATFQPSTALICSSKNLIQITNRNKSSCPHICPYYSNAPYIYGSSARKRST